MEKTLIVIKPDAFLQKVAGEVISGFEKEGFTMSGGRIIKMSRQEAEEFYAEHREKEFFDPLVRFISSNPVMVTVWEGENAVEKTREIIGETDPEKAEAGTIRERWARDGRHNIVHGSDSVESAAREIEFFFPEGKGIYKWKEINYVKR